MISAVQTFTPRELLATGALILLPSDAAALRFRRLFDSEQQASGLRAWQPAHALSWVQWLQSLWSECIVSGLESRLLLNAAQEHQLWRDIVSNTQNAESGSLSSADALATLASAAWRVADAYGATQQLRSQASTHDTRTFAAWAEEFDRACHRQGYLSQGSLEAALAGHIEARTLSVPAKLYVTGFLSFTPQQNVLLDALAKVGSSVTVSQVAAAQETAAQRSLLRAESEEQELQAIAVWIRHFVESRTQKNLNTHIGVLLPDMDADREALETCFRETLAPELQLIGADTSTPPYEFAASEPLASHPMIAAALDLARLATGPLPLTSISALLLSPYLSEQQDLDGSARFDACVLRQSRFLRPEIKLSSLQKLAQRSELGTAPLQWIDPLHNFLSQSGNLQTPRSFGDWSEFTRRLLRAANWPATPSNAADLQLSRAWDHALDTVATLDFSSRRVSYRKALQALEKQTANTPINRSTQTAVVQVMRPSDLPGMSFDAILFARSTDTNLPATESPNPLIDWKLQATLCMPGADHANAAARANLELAGLLSSASNVLFTYAASNGEGKQRLSPSVSRLDWPVKPAADILVSVEPAEHIEAETVADTTPLPPLTSSHVHGGASVLQHQAACGFRAFAEIRLRASELESQDTGFDARESGELLHRVMSTFWTEVKAHSTLQNMPMAQRQGLLSRSIDEAFRSARTDSNWDNAYVALQKQRLATLLDQWLEYELARGPFNVVSTERKEDVAVGPLDLTVRIDRIDNIDGHSFLVDYKTGLSARPQSWLGERPDEPQLPLYALLPEAGTLAGLAFAKVRAGDSMGWQGYASTEGMIPGRNTVKDLEFLLHDWRENLRALAEAFASGDASVRPKDYPNTCTHCGQRLLCRLDPTTLLALSETEESGQEEGSLG